MSDTDMEFFYHQYLKGKISINSIAKQMGVTRASIDVKISKLLHENKINHVPYNPIIPKLIKTEEEKEKKVFYISDWQTMTDEEKELYL